MAENDIPSTMKAWQYTTAGAGLENTMQINPSAQLPKLKSDQNLVRVIAMAVNPVDYKIAELPIVGRLAVSNPATPGLDLVGRVVKPAAGSPFKVGQLVFGVSGPTAAGGAMAEYAAVNSTAAAPLPEGVDPLKACTVGIAGLSACQSILPYVKDGSRVFLNGGSGGVGTFGIQIAKALGCHVTTTCSTANVELCKSLGADEVLDYKQAPVLEQLKKQKPFDHVVDNVGSQFDLYFHAHEYTNPSAKYVFVGASPGFGFVWAMMKAMLLPGFLGGGQRKLGVMAAVPKVDDLKMIGGLMAEGRLRAVVDSEFAFVDGKKAIARQKTGRARGKIVVTVNQELVER
ncbi:uncharacterized protein LTR77_008685 [Saxophila tyrrhenica]|uniref:Enoyl reductase (ER) domain-containing protein n=1 Tax=Saxophila tyrrhenica TaxID=1690608 RepID=A0AAV9P0R5_9PEZI|nr:hypothetical protein LTR77_008685 [Saxophila tyrrhenica]